MNPSLKDIPSRILSGALGALAQANKHAVYYDPGMDHWTEMSVLNAAQAGELIIKAVVAKEHPLLIFRDLFSLEDTRHDNLTVEHIIQKGRTYDFEHLPKLLWVATGERLPDIETFEKLRRARNSIQHFCSPGDAVDLSRLSLEFLYKNIDPLMHRHFDLCAVEYHEEPDIGYDYVVDCLIEHELLFSIPDKFEVSEINLVDSLERTSLEYQAAFKAKVEEKGLDWAALV